MNSPKKSPLSKVITFCIYFQIGYKAPLVRHQALSACVAQADTACRVYVLRGGDSLSGRVQVSTPQTEVDHGPAWVSLYAASLSHTHTHTRDTQPTNHA